MASLYIYINKNYYEGIVKIRTAGYIHTYKHIKSRLPANDLALGVDEMPQRIAESAVHIGWIDASTIIGRSVVTVVWLRY